uniref:G protein-coupled receptor 34 n=1 Tax=Astyanax mexicanus TaxID=7994 RepID=A0A3B1IPX3_ASTMX
MVSDTYEKIQIAERFMHFYVCWSSAILDSDLNQSCSLEEESLRVPFAVLYSLLFLFGLAGNVLALWVFLFLHSRHNSVRVFLINVALADLVLVACLPFRVLYHAMGNYWPLGPRMCKVVGNLFYMNMYVSITLLGLISLDRYVKIQGVRRACCRRWLRGSAWSVAACVFLWVGSLVAAYFNLLLVGVFWLVFILLVASYARIALRLLRASRDKPDLGFYIQSQLSETSCEMRRLMDRTNEVMLLFSALNSCLDPVMYFMLSGSVRKRNMQESLSDYELQKTPGKTSVLEKNTTEF